ncbi:MAG: hypothetical protein IT207_10115 [Fimbriimonadaceae bacterium]|nr:hypothetical protein [Fimbriimonadaceae bacterium]
MCIEVFYGGKSIVAPLGDYTYSSSPPTSAGQAATIQPGGAWTQLATGTAVRGGNSIVIDVPTFPVLSGDEPFVEVQYLPPGARPNALNRLSGSVASSMFFFPTSATTSIWTYGHPWSNGDAPQDDPDYPWIPGTNDTPHCPPDPNDNVTHDPEIGPDDEPGYKYNDVDTPYMGDTGGNRVALFGIDDCFRIGYGHDDNGNGK